MEDLLKTVEDPTCVQVVRYGFFLENVILGAQPAGRDAYSGEV